MVAVARVTSEPSLLPHIAVSVNAPLIKKLSTLHTCSVDIFVDYNIQVSLCPVACLQCRQGDVFAVSVFQIDKSPVQAFRHMSSCLSISFFSSFFFRTYTYPLPVSASLSLLVKIGILLPLLTVCETNSKRNEKHIHLLFKKVSSILSSLALF